MGSRENLPSPHSPRTSVLAAESDRSYGNSPEGAGTPVLARPARADEPSNEPNPDILRELLERKRSLMMLSLQPESQVCFNLSYKNDSISSFSVPVSTTG